MLVLTRDGDVSSETVNVCGGVDGVSDLIRVLGDHCGHDTGEDVSTAALGHAGISRRIDRHCPVWMRDQRTPSF